MLDVSIVIPTKNGGTLFEKVLEAVFHQNTEYRYEVICVDSGSRDGTLDVIRKYPCRLFQIEPSTFGHGRTRNYGASKGTGRYIVFLTQDALPASEFWLQNMIDAMKLDPEIVGGFGIHYPYPDCNLLDQRDLTIHFKNFGETNTVFYLDDPERYQKEESYRHYLSFFSDNNSCVRRDIFEKYPYEDVNFAEDQIWARKMIEMGYKKIYCPYAPVYHSHNFPLRTYFKRYYDEQKGLYEVHQYRIATRWTQLPGLFVRYAGRDCFYILRQKQLKKKEKIRWLFYAFFRDFDYVAGRYLGGNYHLYSRKKQEFLDRHISQQYEQRHQ